MTHPVQLDNAISAEIMRLAQASGLGESAIIRLSIAYGLERVRSSVCNRVDRHATTIEAATRAIKRGKVSA